MANIGTTIYVKLFCTLVGKDQFDNKYYIDRGLDFEKKHKRIVIYKGKDDPTKVPPLWHAWLHYMTDNFPELSSNNYKWQKNYEPNLTGTNNAYFPAGHFLSKRRFSEKLISSYTSWKPNK